MGVETALLIGGLAVGAGMGAYTIATAPGNPEMPAPPKKDDPMKAAYAEMEAMRKRKGAASTIVTGPEGVMGPAPTSKALLGA